MGDVAEIGFRLDDVEDRVFRGDVRSGELFGDYGQCAFPGVEFAHRELTGAETAERLVGGFVAGDGRAFDQALAEAVDACDAVFVVGIHRD
ncbi:hypothetical protein ACFWY5_28080 [Nonomuraea sp. NPDC059007]|uniref:hypothetical protein n=1 Tax=Nonomuraea sp. NPDC059007 TaxID=3346692 RepID=UPI0036979850